MTTDSCDSPDGIDTASVTPEDVDESEVRAALSSSNPTARRRGLEICETLAKEDVEGARPFLDEVASLTGDENAAVALRAIAVLDAVAGSEPASLEGRLSDLVGVLGTDIVDVQLTGATTLGKVAVERPDLLAPHTRELVKAVRTTEPDREVRNFSDVVDDRVTQKTLEEHERGERRRRISGRRTLVNVVVAVTEAEPRSAFDVVDELATLLADVDPAVSGGAVDALGELAAANPAVVAPVGDRLVDCLDHDRAVVRARAVWTLGHLGDDAVEPRLRTVAETDADADVRELAEETANFLADAS